MANLRHIYKHVIYFILDLNWQFQKSKFDAAISSKPAIEQISPVLRLHKSIYVTNFVLAYIISCCLLMPFLLNINIVFILAIPLTIALFKLINHYCSLKKLCLNEQAFLAFLKELISLLHNGTSFENSILILSEHLCKFYGEKSAFSELLKQLCQALSNSWTLNDLQSEFLRLFPNRYAHNYFTILNDRMALSNQLLKISQVFAKNMQAKANMDQEIRANAAQQQMEACILLLMPFAIIYILRFAQTDFFAPALTTNPGPLLLTLAFICIMASALLLFYLFMHAHNQHKPNINEHVYPFFCAIIQRSWSNLLQILPLVYIEKLKRNLLICTALENKKESTNGNSALLSKQILLINYLAFKLQTVVFSLSSLLLLSLLDFRLIYFSVPLTIAVFYLQDLELQSKCQKTLLLLLELLPWDFSLLIMLLRNNYSLINSFAKLQNLLSNKDPLCKKFYYFWQHALLGEPIDKLFFNWADSIANFSFNSYFSALHAYISNGDQMSLAALSEQTEQLFVNALIEHKQAQSKKQTAFVLPMILDLMAVILITLAPVIPSLVY